MRLSIPSPDTIWYTLVTAPAQRRHIARRQWHSWYAWRWKWVGDTLVWLESIERRLEYWEGHDDSGYTWEYRLPQRNQ